MSKFTSLVSRISPHPHRKRNYHSMRDRAIHDVFDLSCEDIKALLWTAIELKALDAQCKPVSDVTNRWVVMLVNQEHYYLHSWMQAADLLDLHLTKTTIPDWESSHALRDIRRYYEINADMLITKSNKHDFLKQLYAPNVGPNTKIPMFNMGSQQCAVVCVLTDLMTYQMHFNRLCGLNLIWFGQVCTLINSYIPLAHKLNINVRYLCHHVTPKVLKSTLKDDFGKSEQIREYKAEADGDYPADVVVVKEESPNWEEMMQMFQKHSSDMIILRAFPHSDDSKSKTIPDALKVRQRHENRAQNLMYVMAAILLRMLSDYNHTTPQPNF